MKRPAIDPAENLLLISVKGHHEVMEEVGGDVINLVHPVDDASMD